MRNCPNCLRSMADEARVCRACYTVVPVSALPDKPSRALSGLKQILILFAVATGAWIFQLDAKLLPGLRPAIRAQFGELQQSNGWTVGSDIPQAHGRVDRSEAEQRPYERVQAKSVTREGQRCSIRQGLRKLDDKPLSRVVLKFTFEDVLGNPIGNETDAAVAAVLATGAQNEFTFSLPCPRSFAKVKVRVPSGAPKIALVSSSFVTDTAEHSGLWNLAVKVPERSICPLPEPCELIVRSYGGGTARYRFHRDAKAPEMLITEDSILIAQLRRHRVAWLQVPSHSGGTEVLLSDQQLRVGQQPGILPHWVGKLFS